MVANVHVHAQAGAGCQNRSSAEATDSQPMRTIAYQKLWVGPVGTDIKKTQCTPHENQHFIAALDFYAEYTLSRKLMTKEDGMSLIPGFRTVATHAGTGAQGARGEAREAGELREATLRARE